MILDRNKPARTPKKRTAKYHKLKEILLGKLQRGELRPGQRFPSDNQLMVEYGLSRSTVRQALSELVTEGLLERIQGKGTFVNPGADQPRPAIEYAELVFYAGEQLLHGSAFYRDVLSGIEEGLEGSGAALLIHALNTQRPRQRERDPSPLPRPRCITDRLRGGLLIFEIFDEEYLRELVGVGLPAVVVDHRPHGIEVASVTFANTDGARHATERLRREGHREIAFLHGLTWREGNLVEDPASVERQAGWLQGLSTGASLSSGSTSGSLDRERIQTLVGHGHYSPEGGYKALREVLARGRRPTAVLASGSGMCVGAAKAGAEANLRGLGGGPVVLLGFGSRADADAEGIGVIHCDGAAMGRLAAQKLLALGRGEGDRHEALRVPLGVSV